MGIKFIFRSFRIFCIRLFAGRKLMELLDSAVILAPHPDDETFGCGQLIAEMCSQGKTVHIIILSDGSASHHGCCEIAPSELRDARYASLKIAAEVLGIPEENLHFCGFPDGKLPESLPEHYAELEELTASLHCSALFAPHPNEGWGDHLAVTRLGEHLASVLSMRSYYYCVWFWFSMPFRGFRSVKWANGMVFSSPNAWEKKRKACDVYLERSAPCGKPYTGVLPEELYRAVLDRKELFFSK